MYVAVGGCPLQHDAGENDFKEFFCQSGQLVVIQYFKNRWGLCKGYILVALELSIMWAKWTRLSDSALYVLQYRLVRNDVVCLVFNTHSNSSTSAASICGRAICVHLGPRFLHVLLFQNGLRLGLSTLMAWLPSSHKPQY